jgi:hypothetical protein
VGKYRLGKRGQKIQVTGRNSLRRRISAGRKGKRVGGEEGEGGEGEGGVEEEEKKQQFNIPTFHQQTRIAKLYGGLIWHVSKLPVVQLQAQ